jgi:hypothetical protein
MNCRHRVCVCVCVCSVLSNVTAMDSELTRAFFYSMLSRILFTETHSLSEAVPSSIIR